MFYQVSYQISILIRRIFGKVIEFLDVIANHLEFQYELFQRLRNMSRKVR